MNKARAIALLATCISKLDAEGGYVVMWDAKNSQYVLSIPKGDPNADAASRTSLVEVPPGLLSAEGQARLLERYAWDARSAVPKEGE